MAKRTFTLAKSHRILRHTFRLYKRKWKKLSSQNLVEVETLLEKCEHTIQNGDRKAASLIARELQVFSKRYFKKNFWEHTKEFIYAIIFALVVAGIVRQMWFEHYEVPTGSMRPTLLERDHLLASKDTYSLNVPFQANQFIFEPEEVQRNGIIVFTVENMDTADPNTKYFGVFPGKKRLIKRLMGKPEDTLYFYGGKIYAMDSKGNDLIALRATPSMESLEYLPIMNFESEVISTRAPFRGIYPSVILKHMNQPIAKLEGMYQKSLKGKMLQGDGLTFSELWGMGNFGMARLLTREQATQFSKGSLIDLPKEDLYLEIRHHPDVHNLRLGVDPEGRTRPLLNLNTTLIPVTQKHAQRLLETMYTARFFIRDQRAARYHMNTPSFAPSAPYFPNIPNGCYEFSQGQAWQIKWGGMRTLLSKEHPLYKNSIQNLQTLFNLGMQINGDFAPRYKEQALYPNRYTYYREGSLYFMGAPIYKKGDPVLEQFIAREKKLQSTATIPYPYKAFIDPGPPLNPDGSLDREFITKYGLKVPENMYLALGDNHAASADSRIFGFVPSENLRGSPSLIVWPFGKNWGVPNQTSYHWITLPRLVVWGVCLLVIFLYVVWQRYQRQSFVLKLPSKDK